MSNTHHILIVEDEPKLASLLNDYLSQSGYHCHWLDRGDTATAWIRDNQPSLVLLDLMLPGKDGLEICREVRAFSDVPIIMLTARVEEIDRIMGLELGADDYVCKPYSPREVVARVKVILRRVDSVAGANVANDSYRNISLDEHRYLCQISGTSVELTPVELRLLAHMLKQPGRVFRRNELMNVIYTDGRVVSDRTIDSHIKNLRKKVNAVASEGDLIHSIYGVGYKLE